MLRGDLLRGAMQVASACVVAEALPGVEHVGLTCFRERGEIWKALQPAVVIIDHGHDLGLLEHEFRDHDGVGVVRAPPGQIAAMPAKPAGQLPADGTAKLTERRGCPRNTRTDTRITLLCFFDLF